MWFFKGKTLSGRTHEEKLPFPHQNCVSAAQPPQRATVRNSGPSCLAMLFCTSASLVILIWRPPYLGPSINQGLPQVALLRCPHQDKRKDHFLHSNSGFSISLLLQDSFVQGSFSREDLFLASSPSLLPDRASRSQLPSPPSCLLQCKSWFTAITYS
jgi:hypothetical protein